jgi:cytosine deaminase
MRHRQPEWIIITVLFSVLALLSLALCHHQAAADNRQVVSSPGGGNLALRTDLDEIEKGIEAYVPDPKYPDDPAVLVTVKEALRGARERNGGIGACLIRKTTGEVLEQSHNRQHEPYFRSDLHAEMDLLNRYEDKMRATRSRDLRDSTFRNPRNMTGIVLYTSVEPCPMCLGRIINAGVKEVYYAAPDENGGMAHSFENLPPFWKDMARGMVLKSARCSPELSALARRLFRPMSAPAAARP